MGKRAKFFAFKAIAGARRFGREAVRTRRCSDSPFCASDEAAKVLVAKGQKATFKEGRFKVGSKFIPKDLLGISLVFFYGRRTY
jgi:hypothetical protein